VIKFGGQIIIIKGSEELMAEEVFKCDFKLWNFSSNAKQETKLKTSIDDMNKVVP
jgi:hypothetical protein